MYLFVNEQKENPNRRLKTLPEDFKNLPPYETHLFTSLYSEIQNVNFSQKEDTLFAADAGSRHTEAIRFKDIPRHIAYKAVHRLNTTAASYFNFENLRKRFAVESTESFFAFLGDIPIHIVTDVPFDELPNKKLLTLCEDFFLHVQSELEQYDNPFVGTEFRLVQFSDMFSFDDEKGKISFTKEKMIFIDETKPDTHENAALEKELSQVPWYAVDSFWGTEEERNLIAFIKNHESNLLEKYDAFQLLRNEEVYKIFDFKTGRGFQPDFLLFLHAKKNDEHTYFQVFIEPKGKHLAGDDNDGWKEHFLEEISRRYGLEHIVMEKSAGYVLIGLPFFNANDTAIKEKFERQFADCVE